MDFTTQAFMALFWLTIMEIILGIDNIVFISIVTSRLPESQRPFARRLGLVLALVMRIALLLTLKWILDSLTGTLFKLESLGITESMVPFVESGVHEPVHETTHGHGQHSVATWEVINAVSFRDIILFLGGLFLVGKSVHEINKELEGKHESHTIKATTLQSVLIQIAILDMVFSLDSVIAAIGMATEQWVMVTAIVISIGVMIAFANPISEFVERQPSVKMLAISFLILIGVMLIAEGVGTHVNKNYIYFAMAFALIVELMNIRMRGKIQQRAPATAPE